MVDRLRYPSLTLCAGLSLGLAGALSLAPAHARAQGVAQLGPDRPYPLKPRQLPNRLPLKPSLPPSVSIPLDPLNFAAPGLLYLGERETFASLDFMGEDRLLFTFRIPSLLHRDASGSEERKIRAMVLALPAGTVEAEADWIVHDRERYLWMLGDGHFLLRNRENLYKGDRSLALKSLLQFPGPLVSIELDPTQQYLVSNSYEPVQTAKPTQPGGLSNPVSPPSSSDDSSDAESSNSPDFVVRILHLNPTKVMLLSRVRTPVHVPIDADGYLETLRGKPGEWTFNLNYFSGGSHILGSVLSACAPMAQFLAPGELLATTCNEGGEDVLVAMTMDGRELWADVTSEYSVWPILTRSANGLRIARESLEVPHSINAFEPLGDNDIKGQLVRVFNAATGEMVFEGPASPVLDGGGNVALSPSGRRLAIVNAGAIQVFDLPAPPHLADGSANPAAR